MSKNTLPHYIDYALSTNYLDTQRVNMKELTDLRNKLESFSVLSNEDYMTYYLHINKLLTDNYNVKNRLQKNVVIYLAMNQRDNQI